MTMSQPQRSATCAEIEPRPHKEHRLRNVALFSAEPPPIASPAHRAPRAAGSEPRRATPTPNGPGAIGRPPKMKYYNYSEAFA